MIAALWKRRRLRPEILDTETPRCSSSGPCSKSSSAKAEQ